MSCFRNREVTLISQVKTVPGCAGKNQFPEPLKGDITSPLFYSTNGETNV